MAGAPTDTDLSPSEAEVDDPPKRSLRRYLEVSWVLGVVAFTVARLVVAHETLEEYGLNIWIFGIIDLATAVPYAIGVAKVVEALIDRRPGTASGWAMVACVCFLAPYLYIVWVGKDVSFPPIVYVVLGVLVLLFGGNAIRSVWSKVRKARSVDLRAS